MGWFPQEYLQKMLGEKPAVYGWDGRSQLPLALVERYDFSKMTLMGHEILLMRPIREPEPTRTLILQMTAAERASGARAVLWVRGLTHYRRKALIAARVPFLVENGQMYLPFLGLHLKPSGASSGGADQPFTPLGQWLFLQLLYHPESRVHATGLAGWMNRSVMSASRAIQELESRGLLHPDSDRENGRNKPYLRIGNPDYFRRGRAWLRSPVQKITYVNEADDEWPLAGLDALARQTMLAPDTETVRAVGQKQWSQASKQEVTDPCEIQDESPVRLEIWRYDPVGLAVDGVVDPLSLALSLQDETDERVQMEMERRLSREPWYTA